MKRDRAWADDRFRQKQKVALFYNGKKVGEVKNVKVDVETSDYMPWSEDIKRDVVTFGGRDVVTFGGQSESSQEIFEKLTKQVEPSYDEPAALQLLRSVISEIDLSGFPIPTQIQAIRAPMSFFGPPKTIALIQLRIKDIRTGMPEWLDGPVEVEGMDREQMLKAIRAKLHEALAHELDEQFLVRGRRLFDPHAPAPAMVATIKL